MVLLQNYCYFPSLIIWLCGIAVTESDSAQFEGPEHRLYTDLFANYTADSRPVKNASHTVVIRFALSLNQLLDLDEKNQILTTSVWIYEEWTDEMLKWSPDHYTGQTAIMIPASSIWLPDVFIFNTAGANMDGFVSVNGSKVAIKHTGNVRWMVPLMVASVCAVDVTYFPYDHQTCTIKFGSWIYDIDQVDIISESDVPDLDHYIMNSEYDLKNVSISRGILDSSCCPGDGRHSMVELKLELRRKSLYYDYIVIAPTIMLCVLTLASFLLPCDRGEKMAIGLTVFLTLYVLQLRIADNVPDTNSTPILGVFMLIVMTFNCVSLIMATLVMNIKKRGDDSPCPDVPSWLFCMSHHVFGRVVCTRYLWKNDIQFPEPIKEHEKEESGQVDRRKRFSPLERDKAKKGSPKRIAGSGDWNVLCSDRPKNGQEMASNAEEEAENRTAVKSCSHMSHEGKPSNKPLVRESVCYDPHKTPHPQSEGATEMRLRKSASSVPNPEHVGQTGRNGFNVLETISPEMKRGYLMKRRWFYVAEVVDKFLFLIYLVLLTFSIFTVLFLIPVYFRNDT